MPSALPVTAGVLAGLLAQATLQCVLGIGLPTSEKAVAPHAVPRISYSPADGADNGAEAEKARDEACPAEDCRSRAETPRP